MRFGYYNEHLLACYVFETVAEWNQFKRSYMNIKRAATRLSDHDINSDYVTSWLELVDDHARLYPGEANARRPSIPYDIRKVQAELWESRNISVPEDWTAYWPEYEEWDATP